MRAFPFACLGAALWVIPLFGAQAFAQAELPTFDRPPIHVDLDARAAPTGVLHAHLTIPVSGQDLTLAYPKWIPGEHSPSGPLPQMVRLTFTAQGQRIRWYRDDADIYEFHVSVPADAHQIEADLDFACVLGQSGFRSDICSSYDQLVVNWWQVVLYPVSMPNSQDPFIASIRLPPDWKYASALPVERVEEGGKIDFHVTSLERLVDSPLIAAEHLRSFPLGGARSATLDLSAETAQALEVPPPVLDHFRRLIAETEALFDGPRYAQYHVLLSLGDSIDHYTLEHRESSENRMPTLGLSDERVLRTSASLVPHEYVHAWNGKYRTPRGLDITTYQDTMRARLIWVYEGLTDYASNILSVRSGFWSEDDLTQSIAFDAAQMTYHTGRTWRPLEDTTAGVQLLFGSDAWSSARRNADLYPEGGLLWLDADTLIRELSHGHRSLDDFCKLFFGPSSSSSPYGIEDIVKALNTVQPYDWQSFLRQRLESTDPMPPLDGITRSGWRLEYSEDKPRFIAEMEAVHKIDPLWPEWRASGFIDLRASIGLLIDEDGTVLDSAPAYPGYEAGIVPGMRLVQVNGAAFSLSAIEQGVRATRTGRVLELDVANGAHITHQRIDYQGGLKWPRLVRTPSRPDMLAKIVAASAR